MRLESVVLAVSKFRAVVDLAGRFGRLLGLYHRLSCVIKTKL